MNGSQLIVSIIEAVIPYSKHRSNWANKLETQVAKYYKGSNYIIRIRMLVSKIKKYGNILISLSPERLAIMPMNHINIYIEYKS